MTKVSDLSPEEQAAHYAEVQRTLARVDQINAELAQREIPAELWSPPTHQPAPAPPAMPRRAAPPPSPPVADEYSRPQHDSAGRITGIEKFSGTGAQSARSWEKWVRDVLAGSRKALIDQLIPLIEEIGADGAALERRILALEERAASDAAATVDLLRQIEHRLAELEQRAVPPPGSRPTLVSESNGDDANAA